MASSSQGGLVFNPAAVRDTMHQFDHYYQTTTNNIDANMETLIDVAQAVGKCGDDALAEGLRAPFADLLLQRRELGALRASVALARAAYQPGLQQTDFSAVFEAGHAAAAGYDPRADPRFAELESALRQGGPGGEEGAGGGAAGEEDDDECMVVPEPGAAGGGTQLAPNAKCPLSQKDILDLQDPVADARRYVYERSAIQEYVRKETARRGRCVCPVAGTSHLVALSDLKRATAVLREQRRREHARAAGDGLRGNAGGDDAIDV